MSEPTSEAERILVDVFGEGWEMRLVAAGIVGGDDDERVGEDQQRCVALAREVRPDLGDDQLAQVGSAWFEMWCCAADPAGWMEELGDSPDA